MKMAGAFAVIEGASVCKGNHGIWLHTGILTALMCKTPVVEYTNAQPPSISSKRQTAAASVCGGSDGTQALC